MYVCWRGNTINLYTFIIYYIYFIRNICQEYGFVNNARVIIVGFTKNSITVRTLDKKCKTLSLPRIKFRFRAAYGESYKIVRIQFPLKLGIYTIYTFLSIIIILKLMLSLYTKCKVKRSRSYYLM